MQLTQVIMEPTPPMIILTDTIEAYNPAMGREFALLQLRKILETILNNIKLEVEDYIEAPMELTTLTEICFSGVLNPIMEKLGRMVVHKNIAEIYSDFAMMINPYMGVGNVELVGVEDGALVCTYTKL